MNDPERIGHCDVCNEPYDVADKTDHCTECGKCVEDCQEHFFCEMCKDWLGNEYYHAGDYPDMTICTECYVDGGY